MNKKTSLIALYSVVLVDLIGFGIVLPLLPFFASKFRVSGFEIGCLFSVFSLCQFICSPLWGRLSDRIGRRPVILIGIAGSCFSYIIFAAAQSFAALFISRMLAGAMGGNLAAAQAYIADVTTEDERSKFMALFGASFGVGFTLGPVIAALTMSDWFAQSSFYGLLEIIFPQPKYAVPASVACLLSLASFLLALRCLKEPERSDNAATPARDNSTLLSYKFWQRLFSDQKFLAFFLIGMFVLAFSQANLYASLPLMCQQTLGMNSSSVGILYAVMGLSSILVQGVVLRRLIGKVPEKYLYTFGSLVIVCGYLLLGESTSFRHVMMALVTLTVGMGFCVPLLQTAISRRAMKNQQGFMMGAAQGMSGLGRVTGPVWGGFLYGISVKLPFQLTALIAAFSFVPAYLLMKDQRNEKNSSD